MDFKVKVIDGKLWIKPYDFEEGVQYALENNIKSLFLTHDETEKYYTIDFSWLNKLPEITTLDIILPLSKESNIDAIYDLKNLKKLSYYSNYEKVPLYHCKLKSLEYLYTHYSKNN